MRSPLVSRVLAAVAAFLLLVVGLPAAAQPPGGSAPAARGATVAVEGILLVAAIDDPDHTDHDHGSGLTFALDVDGTLLPFDAAGITSLDGAHTGQRARVEVAVTSEVRDALTRGGVDAGTLGQQALPQQAVAELVRAGTPTVVSATVTPAAAQPQAAPQTHGVYLVRIQDPATPSPTDAGARAIVQEASTYWSANTGATVQGLQVRSSTSMSLANSCSVPVWTMWEAAVKLFPGVDYVNQPNHIVVVKPHACRSMAGPIGQGTVGAGLMGGLVWTTDGDTGTLIHEIGHNFSLGHANVYWRHTPTQPLEYFGIYSPMGFGDAEFPVGVLDVGYQDVLGVLPANQLSTGASRTVTLAPVTAASGVRGARIIDPATGRAVYVEYRDGSGGDAQTFYANEPNSYYLLDRDTPQAVIDACKARHGASSAECYSRAYFPRGVRIYEIAAGRDTTTFPEARGLGFNGAFTRGKQLTAPGGGFTVKVDSLDTAGATVTIAVTKNTPTLKATPRSTASGSASLDVVLTSRITPTGTVTVLRGNTPVGTATLSGGAATVALSSGVTAGTHRLTVRYNGSDTQNAVSSTVDLAVAKRPAALALNIKKAFRGRKTQATVSVPSPLAATGTVEIFLKKKKIRTLTLSGGKATFKLPKKLKLGKHKVRARYRGDAQHAAANRTFTVKVVKQKAKIKSFAKGTKRVKAGKRYTDDVKLSHKGVLQRRAGSKWVKVRNVPKGKSTIRIKAGKKKTSTKYRILIKTTGKVKGKKSKVLTIRAR